MVDNSNLSAPGEPGYNPCATFQPLVEHANGVYRHYYTPHQQLSVDKSLAGMKNDTVAAVFTQQTPSSMGNQTVNAL
jgi:hypothetical protein